MSFLRGWGARGGGGDDAAAEAARAAAAGDGADEGLGDWLRARREERGYDLDRVERDTRIGQGYIKAIEDEQYELLPAPVYARGFVRSYARYLGLDQEEALGRMPAELPRPPGLDPLPGLRSQDGPAAIPAVPGRWLLVAMVVVVAGGAAFLFGLPRLTDPAGGTDASDLAAPAPASTVGPFEEGTMPDFRNVEVAEARRVLAELNVSVLEFEFETDEMPAGRIFGHSPAAGDSLADVAAVNLIVAAEPPPEETAAE